MRRKIAEFKAALFADKKQATILAGLMVFLLISAGRMLLHMGPAGARAASPGRTSRDAGPSEKSRAEPDAGNEVVLAALPQTDRDIFALDPERFPRPLLPEQSADVPPKSGPSIAEATGVAGLSEREQVEKRVQEEAGSFRLRSTLLGASPIAVIEPAGKSRTRSVVLRIGESFEGFELIEVRLHSITLEKDGVRVELTGTLPDY